MDAVVYNLDLIMRLLATLVVLHTGVLLTLLLRRR